MSYLIGSFFTHAAQKEDFRYIKKAQYESCNRLLRHVFSKIVFHTISDVQIIESSSEKHNSKCYFPNYLYAENSRQCFRYFTQFQMHLSEKCAYLKHRYTIEYLSYFGKNIAKSDLKKCFISVSLINSKQCCTYTYFAYLLDYL